MIDTDKLLLRRGVSRSRDAAVAVAELHEALMQDDVALAVFYADPEYDRAVLERELSRRFAGVPLLGCTTAGEITPAGYLQGSLGGFSVAAPSIRAEMHRLDRLDDFEISRGHAAVHDLLKRLAAGGAPPTARNTFGYLLIDGLSLQEETVVSALNQSLGSIRLFGGSAGDGVRFQETLVYHDGAFHRNAAVITLMQTDLPFEVFKTEHFISSDKRMVVTEADPSRRIVTEINGEPAGREYARMVGLEVDKLTPFIFATYPVVVRMGGTYYVRSIQKVNDDESLTFFCAIDQGIVLTVARGVDLVENLEKTFEEVRNRIGPPQLTIGCDCILRHLELDQRNIKERVGRIFADNNVVGFSTYGEQYNAMHVNQTFTAVAIGGRS